MPVIAGHFVVAYAYSAGWLGDDLTMATAISRAETGWNTDYVFKGPETEQRGLWGINWFDHTNFDRLKLMDPTYNAESAWILWAQNGNQWVDWQSFLDGSYRNSLDAARQAVAEYVSLGGSTTYNPNPNPGNSAPPPSNGSYPIPSGWDPTPALNAFADQLYSLANSLDSAATSINNLS